MAVMDFGGQPGDELVVEWEVTEGRSAVTAVPRSSGDPAKDFQLREDTAVRLAYGLSAEGAEVLNVRWRLAEQGS